MVACNSYIRVLDKLGARKRKRTSNSSGVPRNPSSKDRDRSRSRQSTMSRMSTNGSNNQYNSLNDDVGEHELHEKNCEHDHGHGNEDSGNSEVQQVNTHGKSRNSARTSAEANIKPPPITFKFTDVTQVKNILKGLNGLNMNEIRLRITEIGIKVQLPDEEQYDILMKHLGEKPNVSYFTHTKKQERRVKFCLYGLWRMTVQELDNELKSQGIYTRAIEELPIYERKYNDHCIYKLTFFNEDHMNVTKLRHIRYLFNCSVKWQYFKGKSFSITRCTNCQEWGHGEKNCFSVTLCCRCAGKHKSSECPHIKAEDMKIPINLVKCANCGGNHTANFSGCRARSDYETITQRMRENARINNRSHHNNVPRNDSNNYPHMTSQRFVEAPIPQHNYWNSRQNQDRKNQNQDRRSQNRDSMTDEMLSPEDCLLAMDELMQALATCRTRTDQIRAIGAITIKYVYAGRP